MTLIEDCAQSHGAEWRGRKTGTFGAAAAFSFYPTKNLGACGDGGAVVTADPEIAARLRQLRQYGWTRRDFAASEGWNSRLDELQAAILAAKLPRLAEENARRRAIADRYDAALDGLPAAAAVDPSRHRCRRGTSTRSGLRSAGATRCASTSRDAASRRASTIRSRCTSSPPTRSSATGAGDFPGLRGGVRERALAPHPRAALGRRRRARRRRGARTSSRAPAREPFARLGRRAGLLQRGQPPGSRRAAARRRRVRGLRPRGDLRRRRLEGRSRGSASARSCGRGPPRAASG